MVNSNAVKVRDIQQDGTDTGTVRNRKMRGPRKFHRKRAGRNTGQGSYLLTPLGVFEAVTLQGPVYIQVAKRGKVSKNLMFK